MITEIQGDLLKAPDLKNGIILHCISSDRALGAGIAKTLQAVYNIRETIPPEAQSGWEDKGYCIPTYSKGQYIYNLVTKQMYWDKPTLKSLEESLLDAKRYLDCLYSSFHGDLIMPKIGCGLDRLNWTKVKALIQQIFPNYNIRVYYL